MKKIIFTSFLIIALAITTISNVRVCFGVVTVDINPSALLKETSTTNGFLPSRITTSQLDLINSPAAGLVTCNTTTNRLKYISSTEWVQLTTVSPISMATISATCISNGGTITSGVVGLKPADSTNGGIITVSAQLFNSISPVPKGRGMNYYPVL